jgi:hypothetical protein
VIPFASAMMLGGGGGLFVPSQLSSLKVWLEADDVNKTNGALVAGSDWVDRMGNVTLSGGSATNPVMNTNVLNGHSALNWAGSTNSTQRFGMGTTILSGVASCCFFMVYAVANDPPSTARGGGCVTGFSSDTQSSHHPYEDGTIYEGMGSSARKTTVNPTPALTTFRIYSAHSAANDFRTYLDGTQLYSTATNTVNTGSATRYVGGSAGAVTDAFNGRLCSVLVLDDSLTTGNRQKVEGWLAWRFALTGQLVGGHPWASTPPTAELGDNVIPFDRFERRRSGIYMPNREIILPDRLAA